MDRRPRYRPTHPLRNLPSVHADFPEMPAAAEWLLRPVLIDDRIWRDDLRRGRVGYVAKPVQLAQLVLQLGDHHCGGGAVTDLIGDGHARRDREQRRIVARRIPRQATPE